MHANLYDISIKALPVSFDQGCFLVVTKVLYNVYIEWPRLWQVASFYKSPASTLAAHYFT